MLKLINYEWKKLFQWKFLFILLPMVLVLNGVILSGQIERDLMPSDLERPEETGEEISYEEFLNGVQEQSENMKESIFFNDSRFNRENIEKTETVYGKLHGIEVEKDYLSGIRYVTDYRMTDILLILTLTGILLRMLIYERTEKFFSLIKPAKNGRGKLIFAKYIVMLISISVLTLIFFAMNYVIAGSLDLLGDGSASIQSLDGYMAGPFRISVNQYLVLFFMFKILAGVTAGSLIFFICILCRNQVYSIIVTTIAITGEVILMNNIENYSWLSPLKQFNFATVMDTSSYFNDYINFNLSGSAVSSVTAGIFFMLAASVILLFLSVQIFSKESSAEARLTKVIKRKQNNVSFNMISASLFKGECKKLFFMHKGLFLIGILLLVQVISYYQTPFFLDKTEVYYAKYSSQLEGKLTAEKETFIEQEKQRFENLDEELSKQYERYEKGEITLAVLDYYEDELTPSVAETEGFERAENQYAILKEKEKNYKNVEFVYETGWDALLGSKGRKADILDFLKISGILLLAFAGAGTCEKQTSAELLIQSSYRGRKSVSKMKRKICAIYSVIAAVIAFSFRLIQVESFYTLPGLHCNMQSLAVLDGMDLNMSVGICILVIYLAKVILSVIAGQIVLFLSEKLSQEYTVIFLGSLILIVPVLAMWIYM